VGKTKGGGRLVRRWLKMLAKVALSFSLQLSARLG
jgi:hypothetical protein